MLSELKNGRKVVGAKQSRKAVTAGSAAAVYLAADADPGLTGPLRTLAEEHQVPVIDVSGMRSLGDACGISVGAAVAVLLR